MRVFFNTGSNLYTVDLLDKNKKVLVLGGSGGLGKEIVACLKAAGIKYEAPTHSELDLQTLSVESLEKRLQDFVPDVIINCAAATTVDSDGLTDQFDKIFDINLKACCVLIEYAESRKKPMNIVLLSSSSSTKGRENIALYSASKAGVNSLVESLSKKLAKQDIYLNAVVPKKINTPMIQKLHGNIATHDLLDVHEVLSPIWYLASHKVFGKLIQVRKGL